MAVEAEVVVASARHARGSGLVRVCLRRRIQPRPRLGGASVCGLARVRSRANNGAHTREQHVGRTCCGVCSPQLHPQEHPGRPREGRTLRMPFDRSALPDGTLDGANCLGGGSTATVGKAN